MDDPTLTEREQAGLRQSSEETSRSIEKLNNVLDRNKMRLNDLKQEFKNIGNSMRDEFSSELKKAITHSDGFAGSFERVRKTLEDLALRLAVINPLTNALFGGQQAEAQDVSAANLGASFDRQGGLLGGLASALTSGLSGLFSARAFGGPVNPGVPYMVGERGPEMFIPQTAGRIDPHAVASGVNITMNISTPDAASFRASQNQIAASMLDAARKAQRIR